MFLERDSLIEDEEITECDGEEKELTDGVNIELTGSKLSYGFESITL